MLTPHPDQTHIMELMQILFDGKDIPMSVDVVHMSFRDNEPPKTKLLLYVADNAICGGFSRECDSVEEAELVLDTIDQLGILI